MIQIAYLWTDPRAGADHVAVRTSPSAIRYDAVHRAVVRPLETEILGNALVIAPLFWTRVKVTVLVTAGADVIQTLSRTPTFPPVKV